MTMELTSRKTGEQRTAAVVIKRTKPDAINRDPTINLHSLESFRGALKILLFWEGSTAAKTLKLPVDGVRSEGRMGRIALIRFFRKKDLNLKKGALGRSQISNSTMQTIGTQKSWNVVPNEKKKKQVCVLHMALQSLRV